MPCYHPLTGYYSRDINPSGKRGIVFQLPAAFSGVPLRLPCGRCIGCKLERSRQWAMRCMHEKRSHAASVFLTLTYEDEFLPDGGTLVKRDLQLFMKRLRKARSVERIRYFACGEYGGQNLRPHYHLIVFGIDFPDKRLRTKNKRGEPLYTSKALEDIWPYGFNTIGDVTFDSCAYVARYICDKITGEGAEAHYTKVSPHTGEVSHLEPEFVVMSRRPGVGTDYYEKYGGEIAAHDNVIMNGREVRPPRFYDLKLDKVDPERMAVLKSARKRAALERKEENTPERRRVREQVVTLNLLRNAKGDV